MADEDEIDILGDFSFNSCLAQNNQGIPSCSDREDTVHPEWLLDSTATNWYDQKHYKLGIAANKQRGTIWTAAERELLMTEMNKYGRDMKKISQSLTTKSEAEIQALIEAEYGVHLESPLHGLDDEGDHDDIPTVVQEEIVTDDGTPSNISQVISLVTTGSPTVQTSQNRSVLRKKNNNKQSKNSLLKPDVLLDIKNSNSDLITINSSELVYDDDLIIGSVESVGAPDIDSADFISKTISKQNMKAQSTKKPKVVKKIGNHRRKNYFKTPDKKANVRFKYGHKDLVKLPGSRQRKDVNLPSESSKNPKLQIVLGSGQALPLSDGEQVIKIEKKKSSDSESDIEVDVDSEDNDETRTKANLAEVNKVQGTKLASEVAITIQERKFEPMPRRQRKINLDGGGGCTIMHTESGDLYEIASEPRKERTPRKQTINLINCRVFNTERPAPYSVEVCVSALVCMDVQAHGSLGEVMGLAGGSLCGGRLTVRGYRPAAAAATRTHCDMCPVSQARAAQSLHSMGLRVVGWHHSHPTFPAAPSLQDLRTQLQLQAAFERPHAPFLGVITSQHWPTGRTASHYKCIRVELDSEGSEVGYQFKVRLVDDLTLDTLPAFLQELQDMLRDETITNDMPLDVANDICPEAGITYLEKCISSVCHHLRAAGYGDTDDVVVQLLRGIRDVFR